MRQLCTTVEEVEVPSTSIGQQPVKVAEAVLRYGLAEQDW